MLSQVKSCALCGIEGNIITVEADISTGLPAFDIVGLPDTTVKEAKERVRSAIKNTEFEFPSKKTVINLAPAHLKKEGTHYDLPIAVAILLSSGQIKGVNADDYAFLGELSLSGELRAVSGVLPSAIGAKEANIKNIIVPFDNAKEAALVEGINVYGAKSLKDVYYHLTGEAPIQKTTVDVISFFNQHKKYDVDFSEVKGQENVKRALLIAAAGGHNTLIIGSPGSGKTMLAERLPTILPDMTLEEAIEVTKIHSVANILSKDCPLVSHRPFRSPHHSASAIALVGGGHNSKPGEISLAHNGVLFLDEFPEFKKDAIEAMRQPIEDGKVVVSRINATNEYPCSCMLVAAMNPCKCGYYGEDPSRCKCSEKSVQSYLSRISGPILDRFDIQVTSPSVKYQDLYKKNDETSEVLRERVNNARKIQQLRYKGENITKNADLKGALLEKYCKLSYDCQKIMKEAFNKMNLSARAYTKILKVARTIADLAGKQDIDIDSLAEAISYRALDRNFFS